MSVSRNGRPQDDDRDREHSDQAASEDVRTVNRELTGRLASLSAERTQWEVHRDVLLQELTHRVKNMLAVVQGIAHQTARNTSSIKEFVRNFNGRLAALAEVHNLLVDSNWSGAEFGALARGQLAFYIRDAPYRLKIDGEPLVLSNDLATSFALVLHELAANAVKYGALWGPSGSVNLSWRLSRDHDPPILTVLWRELGGPPAKTPPALRNSLIQKAIPDAKVRRDFTAGGVVCTIELPFTQPAQSGA